MEFDGFLEEAQPRYKREELHPATGKESAGVMSKAPSEHRKPGDFIQGAYIYLYAVGPFLSMLKLRSYFKKKRIDILWLGVVFGSESQST